MLKTNKWNEMKYSLNAVWDENSTPWCSTWHLGIATLQNLFTTWHTFTSLQVFNLSLCTIASEVFTDGMIIMFITTLWLMPCISLLLNVLRLRSRVSLSRFGVTNGIIWSKLLQMCIRYGKVNYRPISHTSAIQHLLWSSFHSYIYYKTIYIYFYPL